MEVDGSTNIGGNLLEALERNRLLVESAANILHFRVIAKRKHTELVSEAILFFESGLGGG